MRETNPDPETITRLLHGITDGETSAPDSLLCLVYERLRCLAGAHFGRVPDGHTLQPTALIHEAWMRLDGELDGLRGREHFFALASRAMRQILADHARGRLRLKRGAGGRQVTIHSNFDGSTDAPFDLVEFDDLLSRLADLNPRHARVVELRALGGLTVIEAAEVLGVSASTVDADWVMAKGWLRTRLKPE